MCQGVYCVRETNFYTDTWRTYAIAFLSIKRKKKLAALINQMLFLVRDKRWENYLSDRIVLLVYLCSREIKLLLKNLKKVFIQRVSARRSRENLIGFDTILHSRVTVAVFQKPAPPITWSKFIADLPACYDRELRPGRRETTILAPGRRFSTQDILIRAAIYVPGSFRLPRRLSATTGRDDSRYRRASDDPCDTCYNSYGWHARDAITVIITKIHGARAKEFVSSQWSVELSKIREASRESNLYVY